MKKVLLSLAVGCLLAGASTASQAVTFNLQVLSSPLVGSNTFATGVSSNASKFTTSLTPSGATSYGGDSTVVFGQTQTAGGVVGANTVDTFTNKAANFTFDVFANGAKRTFQVTGVLNGGVRNNNGSGSSTTKFQATSISVLDAGNAGTLITNTFLPNGSIPPRSALELAGISFNGGLGDIFIEKFDAITPPGINAGGQNLSIRGFIRVAGVPEASTVAMFAGLSVSGLGLLRRRRK